MDTPLNDRPTRLSLLTLPIRIIVGTILLADAAARPLYRPLLDRIAEWRIFEALDRLVARLPRAAILVLFAVPFVIAEPLKVFALLLIATGKGVIGLPLLLVSYLVTFLLVERIYHAGRDKLLSYGWFHWCMEYVWAIQERLKAFRTRALEAGMSILRLVGLGRR